MNDGDKQAAPYEPDFELSHKDVVREDNWAKFEANGFRVLSIATDIDDTLGHVMLAQDEFGIGNIYTGDAYDDQEGRPLRHKPGVSIYVSPDGIRHRDSRRANQTKDHRSADGPAAS